MKKVLSIAGSDCSGGAGIQADLKTFSAHGVFGMSVIVSVVAENTSRVIDIQDITPDMIEKQIDAVFEDIEVDAVKIGMLSTPECMKAVAKKLLQYKPQNVVIDPVMYAKNGCPLMNPTAVSTLIDTVIPLADVLTPNIPEAEKIADIQDSKRHLYEQYALGEIDLETYRTRKAVYDTELVQAKNVHAVITAQTKQIKSDYEIKLKQQEIVQEVGNANMLTKALIDRLINKVYVFPGDRIEIEYATQDFLETKESEKEV